MDLRTFLTRIVFLVESLITGRSNPTTLRSLYPTFVSAASLCCFTAEICPIGWFVSSTGGSGQQRQCVECPYGSTNNATDSTACNGDNAVVYACALLAVTTSRIFCTSPLSSSLPPWATNIIHIHPTLPDRLHQVRALQCIIHSSHKAVCIQHSCMLADVECSLCCLSCTIHLLLVVSAAAAAAAAVNHDNAACSVFIRAPGGPLLALPQGVIRRGRPQQFSKVPSLPCQLHHQDSGGEEGGVVQCAGQQRCGTGVAPSDCDPCSMFGMLLQRLTRGMG